MCHLFKQESEWFWLSTFSEITSLVPNLTCFSLAIWLLFSPCETDGEM